METLLELTNRILLQFQSPTLAFLIGGIVIAALGTRLAISESIYKFIVFMLLLKVGLNGGMAIREANLAEMVLPALFAILIGIGIVLLSRITLAMLPAVRTEDGIATGGLFGAVSGSTLAAAMVVLESDGLEYEAWAPALYPFMDIPALVTAIVLAHLYFKRKEGVAGKVHIWPIIKESLQGSALSALLLGIVLGLLTRPEPVYESFFNPLFRGLLSILMLIMGMEAYSRIQELRRVAHWFAVYAAVAPVVHGLIAFGLGYIAHVLTGFSPGGVVILAVIAASSSDISGPPTLRAGIPQANPSAYVGASTSVGTPIAIAIGIPFYIALAEIVF